MHYSFSFTNQIDQSFLLAKFYQKIHGWFVPENKSFFEGLVVSCSAIIDFLCFDSEKMRYMLVHTFSVYCCLFFTCILFRCWWSSRYWCVSSDDCGYLRGRIWVTDLITLFTLLILSPCPYCWCCWCRHCWCSHGFWCFLVGNILSYFEYLVAYS